VLAALIPAAATVARADGCPKASDEIATDRPNVTNSSIVVPVGSLQNENGINLTGRDGGRSIDGSNSRWRLGIAPCLEVLVDLPSYLGNLKPSGTSGFSDVAPAIKWQISPAPGKIDLSIAAGIGLPTGVVAIAGRGARPYIQLPWSWQLHGGWGVSGMFTEFFRPAELEGKHMSEATFVIEKKLTDRFSVFTEYVGDYPDGARPTQLINSGGMYQITPTQQVDFHVAFGLNRNSLNTIVGLGYSFRVDGLFR